MAVEDIHIRALTPKDLNGMYFAFLDSFGDYPVPFRLNKEQFVRKFVEKLKIEFSLSVGAFDYHALAGFIFTSVNYYNNKLTAYNGGTGVRPSYRGNKITYKMYDFLLPKLIDKGVKQCVLEVLIQNHQAIKAYKSIGFKEQRVLLSFKLDEPGNLQIKKTNQQIEILRIMQPDLFRYEPFQDFHPSFLDSTGMITENIANEEIVEARLDGKAVGYAIFQPAFGRIGQLAVHPEHRHKGIASAIVHDVFIQSSVKDITVINVNEEDVGMVKFLERLGFINQLKQYEMMLPLS